MNHLVAHAALVAGNANGWSPCTAISKLANAAVGIEIVHRKSERSGREKGAVHVAVGAVGVVGVGSIGGLSGDKTRRDGHHIRCN